MALKKCADCGKPVSDAAVSCPNCGRPANLVSLDSSQRPGAESRAKRSGCGTILLGIVIVAAIVAAVQALLQPTAPELPPGAGQSLADSMYVAVHPVSGETMYTDDLDSPKKYLADRINDAVTAHPSWRFPQPTFTGRPNCPAESISFQFADGSVLTLRESPNPGEGTGLRYDSARVVR